MKNDIIIYTDGSSLGNPGRGGWGAVIMFPEHNDKSKVESNKLKVIELGGAEKDTTNNRMEMTAAYEALHFVESKLKTNNYKLITVFTDSAYLLNGITKWVYGWEKKDWKTSTGDEVLNQDLWKKLVSIVRKIEFKIKWIKVKGHSGVHLNERADVICTSFSSGEPVKLHKNITLAEFEKYLPLPEGKGSKKLASPTKVGVRHGSDKKSSKPGYSYVSMVDGKIKIDKTWVECEKRVKGKSGAKYKKSINKEDENNIIALWSLDSLF